MRSTPLCLNHSFPQPRGWRHSKGAPTRQSGVGFEFNRSRLFGLAVPFHRAFEGSEPSVLREAVVQERRRIHSGTGPGDTLRGGPRAICVQRKTIRARPCRIESIPAPKTTSWKLNMHGARDQIDVRCGSKPKRRVFFRRMVPWANSSPSTIGATRDNRGGGCLEYEVQHARWCVRKAKRAGFSGNAAQLYGAEIGQVLARNPDSAFLAEGSPVTVFKGTRIG